MHLYLGGPVTGGSVFLPKLHHKDKRTLQATNKLLKSTGWGMDTKQFQVTEYPLENNSIHH